VSTTWSNRVAWSDAEREHVAELASKLLSWQRIAVLLARRFGVVRSPEAVRSEWYCQRKASGSLGEGWLSVRATARMLGTTVRVIELWITKGWLPVRPVGRRKPGSKAGRRLALTVQGVEEFLSNDRYWNAVDPARIPDAAVREWAIEMRRGRDWVTLDEVARRVGWSKSGLMAHARAGRIPAVMLPVGGGHGPAARWFVRETSVAACASPTEPPGTPCRCADPDCGRPFVRHRAWSHRRFCSERCRSRVAQRGVRARRLSQVSDNV
jgi:hypothetical protein